MAEHWLATVKQRLRLEKEMANPHQYYHFNEMFSSGCDRPQCLAALSSTGCGSRASVAHHSTDLCKHTAPPLRYTHNTAQEPWDSLHSTGKGSRVCGCVPVCVCKMNVCLHVHPCVCK